MKSNEEANGCRQSINRPKYCAIAIYHFGSHSSNCNAQMRSAPSSPLFAANDFSFILCSHSQQQQQKEMLCKVKPTIYVNIRSIWKWNKRHSDESNMQTCVYNVHFVNSSLTWVCESASVSRCVYRSFERVLCQSRSALTASLVLQWARFWHTWTAHNTHTHISIALTNESLLVPYLAAEFVVFFLGWEWMNMSAPNSQLHDCSCFFRSIQVIVHCTAMQHIYWDVCCCAMENGPYNRTESSIWLINETTWNISYAQHGRCMDFFVRFVLVFYGFGNSRGQPAEWMVNFHSKRYTFYLAIIAFGWCDERVEPPTLFFLSTFEI